MDILVLSDGYKAEYSEEFKGYLVDVDHNGRKVLMTLIPFEKHDDSLEALKYTFAKLMKDLQGYDDKAVNAMCTKIGPYLEKAIPVENVPPSDVVRDFVLTKVAIIDTNRIAMRESAGLHLVFSYEPERHMAQRMELMTTGYIDTGFDSFFINGQKTASLPLTMSYKLSCGEMATYDFDTGIFDASVDILGNEVECFFELDDDELGAEDSVAVFEKLYAHIGDYDRKAREIITSQLPSRLESIRENLDDPDLTVDDIMADVFVDAIVCGPDNDIDLTYCFKGNEIEMRITVSGTLKGFEALTVEFGEADEFDD